MQQILSFHNTPIANDFHFENSNNNAPELAINRINILVGSNNAGKSRFMREVMKLGEPLLLSFDYQKLIAELSNYIKIIIEKLQKDSNQYLLNRIFQYSIYSNTYSLTTSIEQNLNYLKNYIDIRGNYKILREFVEVVAKQSKAEGYDDYEPLLLKINELFVIIIQAFIYLKSFHKTYIPTLRSAVTFINEKKEVFEATTTTENKNLFQSSVKYNYELDKVENLDIFTGRDLYDTISKSKQSLQDKRRKFEKFEEFIGITFFGQKIEITSIKADNHEERHITVTFVGEQERELHNYGDGIQTLMLLTYKLFMAQKGDWIFIEEPELNLHPALQREFLRLITENEDIKAKELRIFFTTHSNHLLDLTITGNDDISIFVFEREREASEVKSKSKIREVSHTDLKILHELGVHNSSVFLANCSIWVEGITDRMYVKAYLQALLEYKNEANRWKEDRHYSFFEYAGSNIVHYDFDNEKESELINAKFLANNVMLIADADMGKDTKHDKFKEQLGNNYIKLKVREIENLLSAKQLKLALPKLYIATNDINSKKFEIVEFDEKAYQKIDDKYLRNHIIETLQKYSLQVPKGLKLELGKNGEATYKTFSSDHKEKLATAVVNDIKNKNIKWEDLSKKAQDFTKKIYEFIEAKNKGVIN